MIRYPITLHELHDAIDATSKTWRTRAAGRIDAMRAAMAYAESSHIWSEVKDVYRHLQRQKCAYCERLLPGPDAGAVEHDVEHFRPKSRTLPWSDADIPQDWHRPGRAAGYWWLAYHPLNYAVACKTCNSELKADHFPIAASAGSHEDHPVALHLVEQPLLIYPIGDVDEDPEALLTFVGHVAVPRDPDPEDHGHRRAQVTTAFFDLNAREELRVGRARVVREVWEAIEKMEHPRREEDVEEGRQDLDMYCSEWWPHAGCARAFRRLCKADLITAWKHAQAAKDFLHKRAAP